MRALKELVRPNILALNPYSTARDEDEGRLPIDVWLDANESPYDNGVNRYPDPHQRRLRRRLAEIKGIDARRIFIGNGSDEAIDLAFRIFCRPGVDNAVSIAPTYGMYRVAASTNDVGMREVALGTINNHCCGVIVWNLMLDSERGPNRPGGCQICYGAVDIEKSDYKTIRFNSHYYIIGHLSIFVEPGAFRIEHSAIDCSGIILSSFLNPDDTLAVALLNENDTEIPLSLTSKNKQYLNITLPPRSVTSCRWNPNLENL